MKTARHGENVKTQKEIRQEKAQHDRTVDEVADAYFEAKGPKMKGRGAQIDRYRFDKHVSPILGKRPASSLSRLDLARIEQGMKSLSTASIWGALEILRRILNHGGQHGLCPPLPFKIKLPKKNNEVTEYLEPDDLQRLLQVLDSWPSQDVARMLRLSMYTGMRRGEVFALKDADVDFQQGFIALRGVDERGPKGGVTAYVPMSDTVRQIIVDQLEWRDEKHLGSPYVFPGKGGRLRFDCTAVYRIKKAAKLPKSFRMFHGLRHHFAVTLANSGEVSLDMIGELLTHKDTKTNRRYAKFLPDTKKEAANRAAEMLEKQAKAETSARRDKNSVKADS